ncbi:MAG: TIM barrel protein [Pseudomonadota bacterium]
MLELSANLSTLFTEWPLPERPARAADCGFKWAELRSLEGHDPTHIAACFKEEGLRCGLINAHAGDLTQGELGFAGHPTRHESFRDSLTTALEAAAELDAAFVHVMAGNRDPEMTLDDQVVAAGDAYKCAAARAKKFGIGVLIEPLASVLAPDYLFTDLDATARFVRALDAPGLSILFDVYHMQLAGGDILRRFEKCSSQIAHVQIAAVPDRTEPGYGELDVSFILNEMESLGYAGTVGCEYVPRAGTLEGLGWAANWGVAPKAASMRPTS